MLFCSCSLVRLSAHPQFSENTDNVRRHYCCGAGVVQFVVNLRCRLLSLLRIHSPNCEVCIARERYGLEMRKRLEELNWRTLPHSPADGDQREIAEVFDS